jgi:hypothetical protein
MEQLITVQTIDEFIDKFNIIDYTDNSLCNFINQNARLFDPQRRVGQASAFGQVFPIDNNWVIKMNMICPPNLPVRNERNAIMYILCNLSQTGDLVYRIPVSQSNKILVLMPNYISENLITFLIYKLTKKYTNGFIKCSNFCYMSNHPQKPIFTKLEKLDTTISSFPIPNINTLLQYIIQVSHALSCAQKLFRFTHYDLHNRNIMLKNENCINCYQLNNGQYLYIKINQTIKIIDFGFSRMEFKKNIIQPSVINTFFPTDAMERYEFNPYYDMYCFLSMLREYSTVSPYRPTNQSQPVLDLINRCIGIYMKQVDDINQAVIDFNDLKLKNTHRERPEPTKLIQQNLCTPSEFFDYLIIHIIKETANIPHIPKTYQDIIQELNNNFQIITQSYIKFPEIISINGIDYTFNYFPNIQKNKDYIPFKKLKYQLKETDIMNYISIYSYNKLNGGQLIPNPPATSPLHNKRINIRQYEIVGVNNTLSPEHLAGNKNFTDQNITIALIDQYNGINDGYKFRFDCCGSDQRNYFETNKKIDSGITINSTFFQIKSSFKPIGLYKFDEITLLNNMEYIPPAFLPYYGIIGIDDNGLLKIDTNENRNKYNNIIQSGALLRLNNINILDKNNYFYEQRQTNINGINYNELLFVSNIPPQGTQIIGNGYYIFDQPTNTIMKHSNYIKPGELYHAGNPNPRSMMGITQDNQVVFIKIEGRDERGVGMDFGQLIDLSESLNLKDAINLDGGKSSRITWKKPGTNIVNIAGGLESELSSYPVGTIISFVK